MNENLPVPPAELPLWFRDGSPVTITRGTISPGGFTYQPAGTVGLFPAVLLVFDDLRPLAVVWAEWGGCSDLIRDFGDDLPVVLGAADEAATLNLNYGESVTRDCIHPGVFANPDNASEHCYHCGRDVPRQEL
jgi:hypothetical protein